MILDKSKKINVKGESFISLNVVHFELNTMPTPLVNKRDFVKDSRQSKIIKNWTIF